MVDLYVDYDGLARAIAKRSWNLLLEDPISWIKSLGCPLCSLISDHLSMLGTELEIELPSGSTQLRHRSLETVIAYDHEPLSNVSVGGISCNTWSNLGKPWISFFDWTDLDVFMFDIVVPYRFARCPLWGRVYLAALAQRPEPGSVYPHQLMARALLK